MTVNCTRAWSLFEKLISSVVFIEVESFVNKRRDFPIINDCDVDNIIIILINNNIMFITQGCFQL